MRDAFGFDLTVGDAVVWCNRMGSLQWLSKGVLTAVHPDRVTVMRKAPGRQMYITLRTPGNVALIGATTQ